MVGLFISVSGGTKGAKEDAARGGGDGELHVRPRPFRHLHDAVLQRLSEEGGLTVCIVVESDGDTAVGRQVRH